MNRELVGLTRSLPEDVVGVVEEFANVKKCRSCGKKSFSHEFDSCKECHTLICIKKIVVCGVNPNHKYCIPCKEAFVERYNLASKNICKACKEFFCEYCYSNTCDECGADYCDNCEGEHGRMVTCSDCRGTKCHECAGGWIICDGCMCPFCMSCSTFDTNGMVPVCYDRAYDLGIED